MLDSIPPAARSKHKPFELCDCAQQQYIYHCAAVGPESINAVAAWVAQTFGDDGWMTLGKREGHAFDLFAHLAKAGLGVRSLTVRGTPIDTPPNSLDPDRPYLPGVNQCPNCNVGGCQGCDGNGNWSCYVSRETTNDAASVAHP